MKLMSFIKRFISKNKKVSLLLSLILFVFFLFHFNAFGLKKNFYKTYPNLELRTYLFDKESAMNKFRNDYNVKFLPETEFLNLNLKKIKLNFKKSFMENIQFKSFYLEIFKDNILIVDYLGEIYQANINTISDQKTTKVDLKNISSNLSPIKILDILVKDEYLYVSFIGEKNNCKSLNIAYAKINFENLNFKNFFTSNECGEYILGGRMQFYNHNNNQGILLTTSNHPHDLPDNKPQETSSIFGKILFIDSISKDFIIFSKGHRVPQGLYAESNLILSTEHGPRSGDEINKIIFGKNYGWPIASYGEKYRSKNNNKPKYFKNHKKLGFEEPIFVFVPAIGISEIIKIPNTFSNYFTDNFIVSSLWGSSLHRIKFDENFERVLFSEKIFIGQRIRDLKYSNKTDSIFLALEETGELGILSK